MKLIPALLAFTVASCAQTNFKGGNKKASIQKSADGTVKDAPVKDAPEKDGPIAGEPVKDNPTQENSKNFLSFEFHSFVEGTRSEAAKSLDIYFVVDKSKEMRPYLDKLKASIKEFSDAMKAQGVRTLMRAVFLSQSNAVSGLYEDTEQFKQELDKIQLVDSSAIDIDSLSYMNRVASFLAPIRNEADHSGRLPIIVYISQAVEGLQSGMKDDQSCDIAPIVSTFASKDKPISFFYSVPEAPRASSGVCPYKSGDALYSKVVAEVMKKSSDKFVGSKLGWPFDENTLKERLAAQIKENLINTVKQCSAREIQVKHNGSVVGSWTDADWTVDNKGRATLKNEIAADLLDKDLELEIHRCCDKNPAAACADQQLTKTPLKFAKK